MSLLRSLHSRIRTITKRLSGSAISYSQEGTAYAIALATPGKSRWDSKDNRGQVSVVFSHDWLIDSADLSVTPQRDDLITITENNLTTVYQVLPFGTEGRCWRWSDRPGGIRRIYTKLKSEQAVEDVEE